MKQLVALLAVWMAIHVFGRRVIEHQEFVERLREAGL